MNLKVLIESYPLTVFFVLNLFISAALATLGFFIENVDITILAVLGPSLTAIVLTGIVGGRMGLRKLLIEQSTRKVTLRWFAVSVLVIPVIAFGAIALHSLFGGPELAIVSGTLFPQAIIIFIIALGEEYGWRGYALPILQKKYNALVASVILGLIWGIWHYPGYLIGVAVPLEMPFPVFMLWIVPATVLFTWVFNNSNSVLTAVLMHVAANATFNYLPLLPETLGQIETFYVFVGLLWVITFTIVIAYGPRQLVRME